LVGLLFFSFSTTITGNEILKEKYKVVFEDISFGDLINKKTSPCYIRIREFKNEFFSPWRGFKVLFKSRLISHKFIQVHLDLKYLFILRTSF